MKIELTPDESIFEKENTVAINENLKRVLEVERRKANIAYRLYLEGSYKEIKDVINLFSEISSDITTLTAKDFAFIELFFHEGELLQIRFDGEVSSYDRSIILRMLNTLTIYISKEHSVKFAEYLI